MASRDSETAAGQGIVARLKSLPRVALAAVGTAVIGALVAYFAPGLLDQVTGESRIQVSVERNPGAIDTFQNLTQRVVVPKGQRPSGSPGEGCAGFYPWSASFGAVPGGETNIRLVVQGGSEETLIGGIRARIIEREPPLTGTGLTCPTQAGVQIRQVLIDLDEPNPSGRLLEEGKFRPVAFTVADNETEVFDITAKTEECYCTWVLELVTTQGGDEEVVVVPEDETPFETTAWPAEPSPAEPSFPEYVWGLYEPVWVEPLSGKEYPAGGEPLPEQATFTRHSRGGPLYHPETECGWLVC